MSAQGATILTGKAVIISGGTTGIGRATAKLLAAGGARVFIFGRHQRELDEALAEIGGDSHGTVADQSRQEDIERVFQEADRAVGGCDILINNAAVYVESDAEQSIADIRYVIDTNVLGYLACTHEAMRRMKRKGRGGHIVNVGSMSADLREPGAEIYVATKAAIQAFSESLRKTANKVGIRVSLIEPGAVATPIQEKTPEQEREMLSKMENASAGRYRELHSVCAETAAEVRCRFGANPTADAAHLREAHHEATKPRRTRSDNSHLTSEGALC